MTKPSQQQSTTQAAAAAAAAAPIDIQEGPNDLFTDTSAQKKNTRIF